MILVVDDHSETRYVLVRLLKSWGYDAVEAPGGREAIDFLRDTVPELIILDCNMPCVDGLAVLRAVRADPGLAKVPVVIFSADTKDTAEPAYEELGVQAWIMKGSTDWGKIGTVVARHAVPVTRNE